MPSAAALTVGGLWEKVRQWARHVCAQPSAKPVRMPRIPESAADIAGWRLRRHGYQDCCCTGLTQSSAKIRRYAKSSTSGHPPSNQQIQRLPRHRYLGSPLPYRRFRGKHRAYRLYRALTDLAGTTKVRPPHPNPPPQTPPPPPAPATATTRGPPAGTR